MKTLLKNAKVWPGKNSFTDAVGFDTTKGKIIFIGNKDESEASKKNFDKVVDLKQKLVLPAFTDGHCHFIQGAFVNSQLNLREARTKIDFTNGIRGYRKKNGSNNWIYGGFFSDANFTENIILDKNFLDDILSDVPMIISRFDTHSAIANTKALELSGLSNLKSEFTAEEIIKDNDDELTRELKERAREYVLSKIPAATLKERTDIAVKQMERFHSFGITSISDITLAEDLEIYQEMIRQNKFHLRVDARLPFWELKNIENYGEEFSSLSNRIKFHSLKAFYDGSLSS
jgi:predicted amidohydrolase YtcJ